MNTIKLPKPLNVIKLLCYCRAGYENDMAADLEYASAENNVFGYCQAINKQSYVFFTPYKPIQLSQLSGNSLPISFQKLIFARQLLCLLATLEFESAKDRITDIMLNLDELGFEGLNFGEVFCEYPDTELGKEMAKFCKKFSVPLRQKLRQKGLLSKKPNPKLPFLHLFFISSEACEICISLPQNRSEDYLGISRLKFPSDAPSRSTLKLEEAILKLLPADRQSQLFAKGMTAVDLGACPGGWTYQLVKRGLRVEAIDNGEIAESLMQTGLVKHFAVDGFTYKPIDGHVDWIVCDMIEKPDRVAALITQWLYSRKATSAIFNLKLPMKKSFSTVHQLLTTMHSELKSRGLTFEMQAKHLYHDRDEVTVSVISGVHILD